MWRALLDRLRGRPIERQLGVYRRLRTRVDALETEARALGERPFDEQILAGLALANGKLAEMATGEGRTGMVAASLGAPWLVLLHGVTVLWARRRRRFPLSSSS